MAEAFAVIGVAASIVQLVDVSSKILRRLEDFHCRLGQVPVSLQNFKVELPLLQDTLQQIKKATEAGLVEDATKNSLAPVLQGCRDQIGLLDSIMNKILPQATDSRSRKTFKAIISLKQEKRLQIATKTLRTYVGTLAHFAILSSWQPLTDAKLTEIRQWLSTPDPSTNVQKALKQRQPDTGRWFLDNEEYLEWKASPASSIWLSGIPGCGKTILSCTIWEDVSTSCDGISEKAVAYFCFDFRDTQKQSPDSMVKSLIYQLSRKYIKIPPKLDQLFSSCENGQRQSSLNSLLDVLRDLLQAFSDSYVIIDALDECASRAQLMGVLREMAEWKLDQSHFLVTSRRERDIELSLEKFVEPRNTISIGGALVNEDIRKYVSQRLSDDRSLSKWQGDVTIKEEIEREVTKGAHGMFRWAVCQLDSLGKCRTRTALRKALRTLPSTLDATYERILTAIDEADSDYALCILRWLAFSFEPLSVEQIAEAVAIEVERTPAFNKDGVLEDPMDALDICSSLVTVSKLETDDETSSDKPSNVIALAHYSVKEFLVSQRNRVVKYNLHHDVCHAYIAESCIGYLLQFRASDSFNGESIQNTRLALYAAAHWVTHAKALQHIPDDLTRRIVDFATADHDVYLAWAQLYNPNFSWAGPDFSLKLTDVPSLLFYASLCGMTEVVEWLILDQKAAVTAQELGSALQAASHACHIPIIKILLEEDADVNVRGAEYGTTLQAAPSNSHTVGRGNSASPGRQFTAATTVGRTPLSLAAGRGNMDVAALLAATRRVDLELSDDDSRTPLSYALSEGHAMTAQYLLDVGCSPTAVDSCQKGLLHYAVSDGNCDIQIIKTLLDRGARTDLVDSDNMTPLHYTNRNNRQDVARLLIDNKVPIDIAIERVNWTSKACRDGTSQRALNSSSTSNLKDQALGLTPLHYAVLSGNVEMVRFFLDHGANPNATSTHGETSLHIALRRNIKGTRYADAWLQETHRYDYIFETEEDTDEDDFSHACAVITEKRMAIIEMLIGHWKTDVNAKDEENISVLHSAPWGEPECGRIVSQLLKRGADIFALNSKQESSLQAACKRGDLASVQVLLQFGSDVLHEDRKGMNALHHAAERGDLMTILTLLEYSKQNHLHIVDHTDKAGRGALHHLLHDYVDVNVVNLLLELGININARDIEGNTPLALYFVRSIFCISEKVCHMLLRSGSDVIARNKQGLNLAHLLAQKTPMGVAVLETLTDFGVDLFLPDPVGRTILHHAALRGNLTEMSLRFLLSTPGLCLEDKDLFGKVPLDYAEAEASKQRQPYAWRSGRWRECWAILKKAHTM